MSVTSGHFSSDQCTLGFGLQFEDLYAREGLVRLDAAFLDELLTSDPALHDQLLDARVNFGTRTAKEQSELVIALAPHVEDFLGELFGIAKEVEALQARHNALGPFFAFKRKFIQKRAISGVTREQAGRSRAVGWGANWKRFSMSRSPNKASSRTSRVAGERSGAC